MKTFNKNKFNCLGDAMLEMNYYVDIDKYHELKDTPKETIAQYLCGYNGFEGAMEFMNGNEDAIQYFLNDIKFNGIESAEFISLAITHHCKSVINKD